MIGSAQSVSQINAKQRERRARRREMNGRHFALHAARLGHRHQLLNFLVERMALGDDLIDDAEGSGILSRQKVVAVERLLELQNGRSKDGPRPSPMSLSPLGSTSSSLSLALIAPRSGKARPYSAARQPISCMGASGVRAGDAHAASVTRDPKGWLSSLPTRLRPGARGFATR